MKKTLLLFTLLFGVIITSCKKEWTCRCNVKYDPPLGDVFGATKVKGTKTRAKNDCDEFGADLWKAYPKGNGVVCTIN